MLLLLVAVAALTGTLVALLVDAWQARGVRLDRDLAELGALVDAERARHHLSGGHIRRGGRGDCVICGAHDPYDVARPGAL